jgi:hypothetical protein
MGLLLVSLPALAAVLETEPSSHAVVELQPLRPGITLPVAMGRTLRAGKVKPGTVFKVKTTQRIPVSEDGTLMGERRFMARW